ncbi:MAG TPA: malto-oligosyltrehalose synthase [Casimicrobiaceae bacterium]|nr:malto-oligosyltrehalose synthase [Casimicrobiaceae bacterium]
MNDTGAAATGALDRLAALCGILPAYRDVAGGLHVASIETKRALLATIGIDAATDDAAAAALAARRARVLERRLPPVAVFTVDQPALAMPVTLSAAVVDRPLAWTVETERGAAIRGSLLPRQARAFAVQGEEEGFVHCRFDLTAAGVALEAGYHRFALEIDGERRLARATIIVAPARNHRPAALSGDARVWGLAAQLYALRSLRNWGAGDFGDLDALTDFASAAGADVVALNPLHALHSTDPARASPYSPSSRLFGNPLYLDVEAIDEFADCEEARRTVAAPEFQARLEGLRRRELIDFTGLAAVKREVLEPLYRCFRSRHRGSGDARDRAFSRFVAEGGEALRRHALFETIAEELHAEGIVRAGDWRSWPVPLRDASAAAVASFAEEHAERVEFHAWLQWQFDRQLDAAAERGAERGLGIGLLRDLAVGIDPGGSESWSDPQLYGIGASVGAPPDTYNVEGQNWGLPPLVPDRLRDAAYAPLIATLRRNMRAAGALRIDHVMGLMRLYWIPDGAPAASGAYVTYPFDDLLGVLALESQRHRCLVVGEDLGTVPDEVREGMRRTGILSLRPMYFEIRPDGSFAPPEAYPRDAVVSVGTHDLPTLRGYWQLADLDARRSLGHFGAPGVLEGLRAGRESDKRELARALASAGLLDNAPGAWSPALALAACRFLARTPAKIMLVAMEDVLGQVEQVNLPGTVDEYPNWRRKLERPIEEWARDPVVKHLADVLAEERPSPVVQRARYRSLRPEVPRATYRLQLSGAFTFADAAALVPYLAALGVSHVYLSPYFKAQPGSTHGYDIVDHNALNPEIGTRADLDRLCAVLREHGMRQLADVVPNHVGVLGADNLWWQDVLENGRAAAHAGFFDIDWDRTPDELHGKLLLPVLAERYGSVLERGELSVAFDATRGEFAIRYAAQRFPVDPQSYARVLAPAAERLRAGSSVPRSEIADAFDTLAAAFAGLPSAEEADPERAVRRRREQAVHKRSLAELCLRAPALLRCIEAQLEQVNGRPGDPASFDALDTLLRAQVFRLASWRMASDDINYRRFFDLNDLAALRMEEPEVFDATHGLLFDLVASGQVAGLRIDHPDGLHDPEAYFARLQRRSAETLRIDSAEREGSRSRTPMYIVAEKIIGARESLPGSWPIAGTTGYDFGELVNGLFVDPRAEPRLTRCYFAFVQDRPDFGDIVYRSKRLVMHLSMASELNALASALSRIAQSDRATCDFTYSSLRAALGEVVASFPVYRSYVTASGASAEDRRRIDEAIRAARRRALPAERTIFDFLRDVLTTDLVRQRPEAERAGIVHLAMRFQQFTAPVMAKGMEDTAFYTYNRLLSLNEVGGDPRRFAVSVAAFHEANLRRAADWPHTLLATSTHDSKRSEDVRARLDVLSELPAEWRLRVGRWRRLNRSRRRRIETLEAPTANDEYLLYQTLLGAWPFDYDRPGVAAQFAERIERYLIKVVREAKAVSSWVNPNEEYEAGFTAFARTLLAPGENERFLAEFLPFQRKLAWFGMLNGLAQTLLKLTVPGVPDIYQGCELWNLALVDPDNRRPVDFATRMAALESWRAAASDGERLRLAGELAASLDDGRLKQFVIWRALELRRNRSELFGDGAYLPLAVSGEHAGHVCAFARVLDEQCVVVIVPRLCCVLLGGEPVLPIGAPDWGDTGIDVSSLRSPAWRDALTGARVAASEGRVALAAAFDPLPLALLEPGR